MGPLQRLAVVIVAALMFTASPAMAQTPPTAEQTALAGQLVDIFWSRSNEAQDVASTVKAMEGMLMLTAAFSGGLPDIDEDQLEASMKIGARVAQPQTRAAQVRAYAEVLSVEELSAILAFYRSPDGRAALRSRERYLDQVVKIINQRAARAEDGDGDGDGEAEPAIPDYTPTPAEIAFLASPAGQALDAADTGTSEADAFQRAIAATEADYCAKRACDEGQHELFKRMGAVVAPDRANGEHAMFGDTAGDLFPDPKAAALAKAACAGDAAMVAALVKDGAEPNAIGKEGSGPGGVREMVTPLLWALDCKSLPGVTALLDAGANPNQVEEWGATPVTVAASFNDPAFLRLLLGRGGDPNANDGQETALAIAMGTANGLEWVEKAPAAQVWANWDALLAAGADPLREAPAGLPFMTALAFAGRWEKVEWLMDHGWAGDPVELGRSLETDEEGPRNHTPEAEAAMARVKARLIAKGVKFPIGGLSDLERDERGFYIQP